MIHEMMLQTMYNKYMTEINNPEIRQLFTQLRDDKFMHKLRLKI